jgi:transcriptional regulator of acetoin/glycerol metabolism
MKTRRKKGSVKAMVIAAYDQKMTVPELVKLSGISRYTIYNAATRLGIKLKPARA